jgi:predicted nucleic acid-binding protein
MRAILFDTSMYIAAIRKGDDGILNLRSLARTGEKSARHLWLSAVVLEELYAGAGDQTVLKALQRLERDFDKVKRLLVPNGSDWALCGQILGKIGAKYGYEQIGRARLTNDALIAVSAARQGVTVITTNIGDFQTIAEFRPFVWEQTTV